jgi:hypothetical protein
MVGHTQLARRGVPPSLVASTVKAADAYAAEQPESGREFPGGTDFLPLGFDRQKTYPPNFATGSFPKDSYCHTAFIRQ